MPSFSCWLDLRVSQIWLWTDRWKPSKKGEQVHFLSLFLFFEGARALCPFIGSYDMEHIRSESCSLGREQETRYPRWKYGVMLHLVRTQLLHSLSGLRNPPGMWGHPAPEEPCSIHWWSAGFKCMSDMWIWPTIRFFYKSLDLESPLENSQAAYFHLYMPKYFQNSEPECQIQLPTLLKSPTFIFVK